MKYLILFLISFNLYAVDYEVKFSEYKTGRVIKGADFTDDKAISWLDKVDKVMRYDKQRFLTESQMTPEESSDHLNIQCWDRVGLIITYRDCVREGEKYEVPAKYKISITDVTAILAAEKEDLDRFEVTKGEVKSSVKWINDHVTMEPKLKKILKTLIRSNYGK